MANKLEAVRAAAIFALILWGSVMAQNPPPQPAPSPPALTDRDAAAFLAQLSEALQGHSQKKLLALFDLSRMKDAASFQQQITAFFVQAESIRVHLNLVGLSADGETSTVAVDAEMEVEPSNGSAVTRKNERLNFVAVLASGRWKFVDVQPRSFFSLP